MSPVAQTQLERDMKDMNRKFSSLTTLVLSIALVVGLSAIKMTASAQTPPSCQQHGKDCFISEQSAGYQYSERRSAEGIAGHRGYVCPEDRRRTPLHKKGSTGAEKDHSASDLPKNRWDDHCKAAEVREVLMLRADVRDCSASTRRRSKTKSCLRRVLSPQLTLSCRKSVESGTSESLRREPQ